MNRSGKIVLWIVHVLLFVIITAAFVYFRLPLLLNVDRMAFSTESVGRIFNAARIGADASAVESFSSIFDRAYINFLSYLFLFLGNKPELIVNLQIVLQVISYVLLIAIGFTFRKSIFSWILPLLYAVVPMTAELLQDVSGINLWIAAGLLVLWWICLDIKLFVRSFCKKKTCDNKLTNIVNDKKQEEELIVIPVVDKTAPIENVLPMPKKHVPKTLDYAFEPTEDQMHYDIEITNSEYDV